MGWADLGWADEGTIDHCHSINLVNIEALSCKSCLPNDELRCLIGNDKLRIQAAALFSDAKIRLCRSREWDVSPNQIDYVSAITPIVRAPLHIPRPCRRLAREQPRAA